MNESSKIQRDLRVETIDKQQVLYKNDSVVGVVIDKELHILNFNHMCRFIGKFFN